MMGGSIGILIADAHPLSRQGLVTLVAQRLDTCLIDEAQDARAATAKLASSDATRLLLVDFDLPGLGASTGLQEIRMRFPAVLVVVVAATRCRTRVLEALGAGVHGYILKDSSITEMVSALDAVLAGHIYVPTLVSEIGSLRSGTDDTSAVELATLTDRQSQVLHLLSRGHTNKEIARLLQIAEGTVKVHVAAAFRSLGVHNRVSAVAAIQGHALTQRLADNQKERSPNIVPVALDHGTYRPILAQIGNER